MRTLLFVILSSVLSLNAIAQNTPYPGQPIEGPGGADYTHHGFTFTDVSEKTDGYWLFEPSDPKPDSADVVVFLHGYGSYNPMVYGKWIKHLVAKGNIVIYPRYQKNNYLTRAGAFPANAATGIRDALASLQAPGRVHPRTGKVAYIGHSYGGVIAANLGVNWEHLGVRKPASMLLCEPGSGPLKGARLSDYACLPADCALVVVVGENDYVVGDEFGRLVFNTAVHTPRRNLVVQYPDSSGQERVRASHAEPYCNDTDFDTGMRNYTVKRALQTSRLNAVDFNCYWKFGDALLGYSRQGILKGVAFGNSLRQQSLGTWSNGQPIRPLEVETPPNLSRHSSSLSAQH
ncbi:MAG: alpha/beta hydrolase [Lewinellaceae bacterium]|nr:alpha/beta hydrolase [Lewinellaceae bacterium]